MYLSCTLRGRGIMISQISTQTVQSKRNMISRGVCGDYVAGSILHKHASKRPRSRYNTNSGGLTRGWLLHVRERNGDRAGWYVWRNGTDIGVGRAVSFGYCYCCLQGIASARAAGRWTPVTRYLLLALFEVCLLFSCALYCVLKCWYLKIYWGLWSIFFITITFFFAIISLL